ncbi:MAG: hypothetical protein IT372_15170, partial [Polyangiaceae bacterium]|nr:hypothetical protein [Polyangiaceae bacterium]
MTDKHDAWTGPGEGAAQPHSPGAYGGGGVPASGIPFRPLPATPLQSPGALYPLRAQYGLSIRAHQGYHAAPAPAPPQPQYAQQAEAAPRDTARGGTLPPGMISAADVAAAGRAMQPSYGMPFAPPADPGSSGMPQVAPVMPFAPAPPATDPGSSGMPQVAPVMPFVAPHA